VKIIAGKVAFITGGASGIGFGMAQAFLRAGMKVVIADVSQSNLDDAAARLGPGDAHHFLRVDVTDRAAMAAAADESERRFGHVHVLCNNAGLPASVPMTAAVFADWDRMLDVNLNGVINGVVTFMPRIRAHREGGHIVNTSSMAGIVPLPDLGGIYTTSKFAVRGLSESLRLALAADGIGVSLLCPGLTKTRIFDQMSGAGKSGSDEGLDSRFIRGLEHAMDPLLVGEAVLRGIRRNDAFILPHAEFMDEVRTLHEEIMSSFRTDIEIDPERAALESGRRQMTDDIKAAAKTD